MSSLESIFKAYDIRGRVGTELTPEVAKLVGKAFATWLPENGTIAVGRDMRPDSAELSESFIDGLRVQGRDVLDIGEVTSDMIYFAVGNYKLAGGVVITASHNPGAYNGIKLCQSGAKPVGEDTGLLEIRDLSIKNIFKASSSLGKISQKDITKDWINHVLTFIPVSDLRPLHIAVDAGNGMAGKVFPELEPYIPFQIEELFFELDGTFPNHIANPLELKNLLDIQKVIKEKNCDAGLAFDGDGDRAVLIDEKGEPLSGTVLTALLADYFLEKEANSTILYNAICGRVVEETIKKRGGKAVRTRVGHSFIKAKMREYKALFAGEHSGHYYFKDNFMADSGLIAGIIGLYILSISSKKLSELAEPYRKAYQQIQETNFEVKDKDYVLRSLEKAYFKENVDWLDGLTVTFKSAWFNVRPSNTEPVIRLNAEAKTKEELDSIVSRVKKIILENN